MKKRFFVLLILASYTLFAQKEATYWYFGQKAGLDFSTSPPKVLTDGQLSTLEGCSTISDKDGNLLFYSDGTTVWNKNHEIMTYSSGALANDLLGNPSSTQSALVVPNPKNTNLYYIFTVGAFGRATIPGFNYYTIDMSKNNGLGEIINGPVDLSKGNAINWKEKVTAVQGKDCETIWILSSYNQGFSTNFITYKITKDGIDKNNAVLSNSNHVLTNQRGYLKVSPDGTKVAAADYTGRFNQQTNTFEIGRGNLFLFDFNTTTGKVSSLSKTLLNPSSDGSPYGLEFSKQSTKLYASTHDGANNKIFQFDITSQNIPNSKKLVHQQTGYRGGLQLAIDSKIYVTVPISYRVGTQYLDIIENPDEDAANVTYKEKGINLGQALSTQGLPPFIQSFFAPVNIVNDVTQEILNSKKQTFCVGDSYTIKSEKQEAGAKYTWTKDGKIIGKNATLTITNNNYGSGIYKLEIDLASECKKKLTGSVEIEFKEKPTFTAIPTYEQCDFDSNPIDGFTTFNLRSKEQKLSNRAQNIKVTFFKSQTDLDNNNPITTPQNYTNTQPFNQQLFVKLTNTITGCYKTGTLDLKVNSTSLKTYPNMVTCELDNNISIATATFSEGSSNGIFDFDTQTAKIIQLSNNAFSLATHSFEYYKTKIDASLQNNKITKPYKDNLFTDNSEIFVRIATKKTNACESIGQFKVFVKKLPKPQGNPNITYLCVNNPVDNPQLITVDLNADTKNTSDIYKWYFNTSLITNTNKAIYKTNKEGTFKVEALRNYPNLSSPCVGYNTFTVKTSNKAVITGINNSDDADNPNNNKIIITVSGLGNYKYALNTNNTSSFVTGNKNLIHTFTNIPPGINTVYVKDVNGCGIVQSKEISSIYFQRHFTPNGDGFYDTWKILGINNNHYQSAKIEVFNRFGKLVASFNQKNNLQGWDGTYNGKLLPPTDYWYKATLINKNGTIRNKLGHFSLIKK